MDINSILTTSRHRQWNLPSGKWLWYQEWNEALFLHFKVDEQLLRKELPDNITIDLYKGSAWVSIVAFKMEYIRPRLLPAVSNLSFFNEINLRTYVTLNGKPGVFFLDIIANNRLASWLAKQISYLPYKYRQIEYSKRCIKSSSLCVGFEASDKVEKKTGLDLWLTERYCLYNKFKKDIYIYEIHHLPWNLQKVATNSCSHHYPLSIIAGKSPDLCHYSKRLQVLAWPKEVIKL